MHREQTGEKLDPQTGKPRSLQPGSAGEPLQRGERRAPEMTYSVWIRRADMSPCQREHRKERDERRGKDDSERGGGVI